MQRPAKHKTAEAVPATELPADFAAAALWTPKGLRDTGQQGLAWSSTAPPYTNTNTLRNLADGVAAVLLSMTDSYLASGQRFEELLDSILLAYYLSYVYV